MRTFNNETESNMTDAEFKTAMDSPLMDTYHRARQSGLPHVEALKVVEFVKANSIKSFKAEVNAKYGFRSEVKPTNIINFEQAKAKLLNAKLAKV